LLWFPFINRTEPHFDFRVRMGTKKKKKNPLPKPVNEGKERIHVGEYGDVPYVGDACQPAFRN